MNAYIGKNTFNGTYIKHHPEADGKSFVAEALPFTPGVHEYWDAFIKRILEEGFNGFVFEDPEMYHEPNQNEQRYKTFWEPWAAKYGFKSVADTNINKPPLGVQVEYYTWLFREFDQMIQRHAKELGRADPEIYLISHILVNRIMKESKSEAEQKKWLALIDQKHGRKLPFVLFEDNEKEYVKLLGKDRCATLGGRGGASGGSFRTPNINNDRRHGDLGMDIAEERAKQRRMIEAGGYGSMAYIFQWSNTEVFGYLGAQYLWQHAGVPGINNEDEVGFLDYAYRIYYGDKVGALVGQAYSISPCVSEWNVIDDDPATIWMGGPFHRDFQLLVVLADESEKLAQQAYKLYTGREPDLYHPIYDPDAFRWNGYDRAADKVFKTERLRLMCVASRRATDMCMAAWASRVAKQKIAQGANIGAVCEQFDQAIAAARDSELLYFANYEDDYRTGASNTQIRVKIEAMRSKFLEECGAKDEAKVDPLQASPEAARKAVKRHVIIDWEKQTDILPQSNQADKPGLYFSTDIGLNKTIDFYCVGAVFTVQAQGQDGAWHAIFRRAMLKKDAGWQHWDIPLGTSAGQTGKIKLRLMTDAYSRALDRTAPTWKWGYWGRPQVVEVTPGGLGKVRYDLIKHLDQAKTFVQLDNTGQQRAFDAKGEDSTGATFKVFDPTQLVAHAPEPTSPPEPPEPPEPAIAAFAPHVKNSGVTIAEFEIAQ